MHFNGSAVRRPRLATACRINTSCDDIFNGSAVRRPRLAGRLDHQGYYGAILQWVRGPKTAVSRLTTVQSQLQDVSSMGPRSEDRG